MSDTSPPGTMPPLDGIRVLEVADHRGEFCGRLLANLGAEVIKVEPPGGSPSRRIGPFFQDVPDPERSLFWWQYNLGKRGVTLDLGRPEGVGILERLAEKADVLIESFGPGGLERVGLPWERLHQRLPRLVVLSVSDFGLDGPWSGYQGSDLVALAVGGQMMASGYPSGADGKYDTPPIAPQMHQSIHLVGCLGTMDVMAALAWRDRTGHGQRIDLSLHAAANNCTENHLSWYMVGGMQSPRRPQFPEMFCADGKYLIVGLGLFPGEWERVVALMDKHGMAEDLKDPRYRAPLPRRKPEVRRHIDELVQTFLATQEAEPLFHEAQREGAIWAPIRQPHESLEDPHFKGRGNFAEVAHEDLGRSFTYPGSPWVSEQLPWTTGPRAPHVGEHNLAVYGGLLGMSKKEIAGLKAKGVV